MKNFPKLSFHKATKEYYLWRHGRREYLGREVLEAQRQYDRLKRQWERSQGIEPLPVSDTPALSVAGLLLAYLNQRTSEGAESRELGRIRTASKFVRSCRGPDGTCYGEWAADDFKAKALKTVRQAMIDAPPRRHRTKPRGKGKRRHLAPRLPAQCYSRCYVNMLTNLIRRVWQWGVAEELVHPDAWNSLRAVTSLRLGKGGRETLRIRPVGPEAVAATLPFVRPVVRAMIQLQQLAGMRPGELVLLRRQDISTSVTERIPLPNTADELTAYEVDGALIWLAIPASHKTMYRGKPRAIALGPKAQEILRPFLEGCKPSDFLFSPVNPKRKYPKNAKKKPGLHYTTLSYGRAVGYAIEKANKKRAEQGLEVLPHWRPNQLRHHVGTAVAEEFDEYHASSVLGNGADAIRVYVEQCLKKAGKVAAKMG